MRTLALIFGLAVLYVVLVASWQIGTCIYANAELHDDMEDIASQLGWRIGLATPSSDQDFREDVLRRAQQHGIDLAPEQVIVRRTAHAEEEELYLGADYTRSVHIFGVTYSMHFTPEARRMSQASDWRGVGP